MKEKPILFSTEMVRAILEGRKIMTRRVIKPQPSEWNDGIFSWRGEGSPNRAKIISKMLSRCPYGQVGNRLWVRETWSPFADKSTQIAIRAENEKCLYKADYRKECPPLEIGGDYHWHPSIFMPRWASRITLEVTEVRVEKLQEITPEDAVAEGAEYMPAAELRTERLTVPQIVFAGYWDSINAQRGYSWESNPYVWLIRFKRVGE